jgi:cytochrome c oxidase assembly protein subunit 11
MMPKPDAAKNKRLAFTAAGLVAGMLGLSYASVPLYSLFCKVTGFGGTTQVATAGPEAATSHEMSIRFDANIASNLAWRFHPAETTRKVKVGDVTMVHYVARNTSDKPTTGSAVFNVTPPEAGIYFNKIECFCFTKQTLQPGQNVELPVQFFVDPAILEDPDTRAISEITLSYTFYPATPDAPGKQATLKND